MSCPIARDVLTCPERLANAGLVMNPALARSVHASFEAVRSARISARIACSNAIWEVGGETGYSKITTESDVLRLVHGPDVYVVILAAGTE